MVKYILIWALLCYIESKIEEYLNKKDNHQE